MNRSKQWISKPVALFSVAAVVTLIATGILFFRHNTGSGTIDYQAAFGGWVYGSADQKKASAVLAKAQWTDYRWEDDRLMVPAAKRNEYEQILGENQALPSAPSDVKREALTEMTQFEPESKTRLRDLYSSAWQLEQTLSRFEQIESATVGVHTRREQVGLSPQTITTATVGVWIHGGETDISPELISAITLAAKHQLGIADNENISIMDLRRGRSYRGDDRAAGDCRSAALIEEQRRQEERWREKFEQAFDSIPGLRVTSTVELAAYGENGKAELPPPPESNSAPQAGSGEFASMTLGNRFDSAGTLVFRPNQQSLASETPEITETPDLVGEKTVLSETSVSFRPKKIAVVLALPDSYVRKSGERSLETVRQTADGLLNASNVGPENRSVRLLVYPDVRPDAEKTDAAAKETAAASAVSTAFAASDTAATDASSPFEPVQAWFHNLYAAYPNETFYGGSAVAAIFLLFVGALIARSKRRNRQKAPASIQAADRKTPKQTTRQTADATASSTAADGARPKDATLFYLDPQQDEDAALDESLRHIRERQTETRTEIAGRIEEDPRRAADILKEWIKTSA